MRTSGIRRFLGLGLAAGLLVGVQAPAAIALPTTTLVPIGSDYQPDTLQLFAGEAAHHSSNADVHILVIPITYSLSAESTTKSERKKNLTLADHRRSQVEDACNVVKADGQTCRAQLVPVLIRDDAEAFDPTGYFEPDLDGMFVLGGDQTVAMNAVHDTPLEDAMTAAFEAGAALGGNSAGDAVQSRDMINGYFGSNGPAESMQQGAVQVCYDAGTTTCQGGLRFGFPNLITDQHVFEYGRTGRSLNVSLETGKPVLGMDAATGAVVTDYTPPAGRDRRHARLRDRPRRVHRLGDLGRSQRHPRRAPRRAPPAARRLRVRLLDDDAEPVRHPEAQAVDRGPDVPGVHHRRHGGAAVPLGRHPRRPGGRRRPGVQDGRGRRDRQDRRARRGLRQDRHGAGRRQGDRRRARPVRRLRRMVLARRAHEDRRRRRGDRRRDRDHRHGP